MYTLSIVVKKYTDIAKKMIGLAKLSYSDFPDAHRIINSLSFRNLLILSKTDRKRHIGIVINNIFGNNNNMYDRYATKDTLSDVSKSICLSP